MTRRRGRQRFYNYEQAGKKERNPSVNIQRTQSRHHRVDVLVVGRERNDEGSWKIDKLILLI